MFTGPIHSLAFERAERFFFAASSGDNERSSSSIHEIKLYQQYEDRDSRRRVEAIGGAGLGEVNRHDVEQEGAINIK